VNKDLYIGSLVPILGSSSDDTASYLSYVRVWNERRYKPTKKSYF